MSPPHTYRRVPNCERRSGVGLAAGMIADGYPRGGTVLWPCLEFGLPFALTSLPSSWVVE